MLTKQQRYLQRQWIKNRLDISKTARRFGYKGASLTKGMARIRDMLNDIHIQTTR